VDIGDEAGRFGETRGCMQRESCGMGVAKRGVFTFCAVNDFNDLSVAKTAQTQLYES
jgi:hypothetical protein